MQCSKSGTWEASFTNTTYYKKCRGTTAGIILRHCNIKGIWEDEDATHCISSEIELNPVLSKIVYSLSYSGVMDTISDEDYVSFVFLLSKRAGISEHNLKLEYQSVRNFLATLNFYVNPKDETEIKKSLDTYTSAEIIEDLNSLDITVGRISLSYVLTQNYIPPNTDQSYTSVIIIGTVIGVIVIILIFAVSYYIRKVRISKNRRHNKTA